MLHCINMIGIRIYNSQVFIRGKSTILYEEIKLIITIFYMINLFGLILNNVYICPVNLNRGRIKHDLSIS